jgi:glycosyltransferase involved in cell wall biosynthesis
MKIIYLHQYFATPQMSGGTRSYELARRLVAAGHEVHVVTTTREGPQTAGQEWGTTNEEGVHVHWTHVEYRNQFGFLARVRAFLSFAWRSGSKAVALRGDLVFATSTPLTIALPAIYASRRLRAPMVFEVRDVWPEVAVAMGEISNPFLIWAARLLERTAYRNAVRVIALSPGMADGVANAGYPRENIKTIPNACDIDLFQSRGEDLPPDFLPPGEGPLVLYAGTFGRANGVDYLADVAAEMKQLKASVRFLLVGDGAERERLEQRAAANGTLGVNLWIRRPVSKRNMPALFRNATVATSLFIDVKALWDNSANKFFDALAAGRPVLINYGGWQKDILDAHGAGISVRRDDPVGAARALLDLLNSPERLARAQQASLNLARTQFNRDSLAERFRATLESAAMTTVSRVAAVGQE